MSEARLAAVKAGMTRTEKIAGSLLFGSLAIGFGGALSYETYAIAAGRTPTISKIAAGEITVHPRQAIVVSFIVGGVVAGLVAHFADMIRVWEP